MPEGGNSAERGRVLPSPGPERLVAADLCRVQRHVQRHRLVPRTHRLCGNARRADRALHSVGGPSALHPRRVRRMHERSAAGPGRDRGSPNDLASLPVRLRARRGARASSVDEQRLVVRALSAHRLTYEPASAPNHRTICSPSDPALTVAACNRETCEVASRLWPRRSGAGVEPTEPWAARPHGF